MGLITLPIGASNSGTNDWSDVHGEDQAIVDQVNGNLVNANLSGSAGITDANLASPNNSAYKTILHGSCALATDSVADTHIMSAGNAVTAGQNFDSGSDILGVVTPALLYFDNDDFTVGSKTQKLRLRAQVAANATQPTITFTFGLYPATVAGAADTLTFTLGTVVTSSTVAIASPAASTITSGVNSDFTIPSDGAFALGVVTDNTLTNNSAVICWAQLQTRNV